MTEVLRPAAGGFLRVILERASVARSPRDKSAKPTRAPLGTGRDGAIDYAVKEEFMEQTESGGHVYRVIEVVGTSEDGIEAAINAAIARAHKTIRNLRW